MRKLETLSCNPAQPKCNPNEQRKKQKTIAAFRHSFNLRKAEVGGWCRNGRIPEAPNPKRIEEVRMTRIQAETLTGGMLQSDIQSDAKDPNSGTREPRLTNYERTRKEERMKHLMLSARMKTIITRPSQIQTSSRGQEMKIRWHGKKLHLQIKDERDKSEEGRRDREERALWSEDSIAGSGEERSRT
ncbi:unnamed protein product [Linum trigynum]|uniref:Uncharacterized protein n=1 Tax=Linum trigynum TaxID=586398 RepID=A0AAV2G6I6_9ROSI